MQLRKLTRIQKEQLTKKGLIADNWLLVEEKTMCLIIRHKLHGTIRTVFKV